MFAVAVAAVHHMVNRAFEFNAQHSWDKTSQLHPPRLLRSGCSVAKEWAERETASGSDTIEQENEREEEPAESFHGWFWV